MKRAGLNNELPPIEVGILPPRIAPQLQRRKDMVPEREYSFEIPPDPIPASDIKEQIDAEVVIVGAGMAGLSAAISAAETGAKTILIEKTRYRNRQG